MFFDSIDFLANRCIIVIEERTFPVVRSTIISERKNKCITEPKTAHLSANTSRN